MKYLAVALTHRGLDRRIGLLLRLGRLLAGAHRGGLRRRLALLVGALADLEALDHVVRDEVSVDDLALVRVLCVAVPDSVVVVPVGLAAATHVELDNNLCKMEIVTDV